MTREEAHRILSNGLVNAPSEHEWCMAFEMAIKTLKQTEALEKIRVDISEWLDKTEAEIAEIQLIGYATVAGKRKIVSKEVLQIIDKRRTVSQIIDDTESENT